MRKLVIVTLCLGLAACSPEPENSTPGSDDRMVERDVALPAGATSESAAMRAPGIAVTAAPGVAFAYRYAFRMPADKIAHAQEVHAQACEKLGVARCRIVGLRFRRLGEYNIEAMLAFKLDPTLARGFGRDGIATIEAAAGQLVDAEISGTDAGAQIKRLNNDQARADEQLKRIDAELANPKLKSYERAALQSQRDEIVRMLAATRDSKADQQESLATTPMTFEYGAGPAVRGFDPSAPLTSAADTAIASAQITLAILLGVLAVFGPPGLVLLAALLLWRRFRPRHASDTTAL